MEDWDVNEFLLHVVNDHHVYAEFFPVLLRTGSVRAAYTAAPGPGQHCPVQGPGRATPPDPCPGVGPRAASLGLRQPRPGGGGSYLPVVQRARQVTRSRNPLIPQPSRREIIAGVLGWALCLVLFVLGTTLMVHAWGVYLTLE